jgi:hypothetical protein
MAIVMTVASIGPAKGWAEVERHSGTIRAVDQAAGTLVLDEVGPWRMAKSVAEVTPLTVALAPETEVLIVTRAEGVAPTGWPGDYIEMPSDGTALKLGEFVTLMVTRQGDRLTVEKAVLVSTPSS